MVDIDGSYHEGGGQIVRTSLALSTLLGKPFEIKKIRLGRDKPGLKNQHMHGVKALQAMYDSHVVGAELGSTELIYAPRKMSNSKLMVDIGTAGSITLMLQSMLLPLVFAKTRTSIEIIGGTDVKWSMPMDYLKEIIIPQLTKYADINLKLEKRGYYPKGNGSIVLKVKPKFGLDKIEDTPPINLMEQGKLLHIKGVSHASKDLMDAEVAERQANTAKIVLGKLKVPVEIRTEYQDTLSTGSGITLWAMFGGDEVDTNNPVILGADCLGERGLKAEVVGKNAADKLLFEIENGAACDSHLADNLIPFMGLVGGSLRTSKVTDHALTNIYTTENFVDSKFKVEENVIKCEKDLK